MLKNMKKIKDKVSNKYLALAVVPSVMLATTPSAHALGAAVTAAKTEVEGAKAHAVTLIASILVVGAAIWAGMKLVSLLRR